MEHFHIFTAEGEPYLAVRCALSDAQSSRPHRHHSTAPEQRLVGQGAGKAHA